MGAGAAVCAYRGTPVGVYVIQTDGPYKAAHTVDVRKVYVPRYDTANAFIIIEIRVVKIK